MSVRFHGDSDRRAWRTYAAAALTGLVASAGTDSRTGDRALLAETAARLADALLAEERARRRPDGTR